MPIYRGTQKVTPRRAGADLARVYRGDQLVWQAALPVVQITGTTGYESRNQFRQACIDYGTTYGTVEVLPFRLDTSQATNMQSMFYGCSVLTTVPDMDTSQSTSMYGMFNGCSVLTTVPDMDTSQAWSTSQMFYGCSALTTVPDMDTSQATSMYGMFNGCSALTTVPDLDTANARDMAGMFKGCSALTDGNVRCIGKHPNVKTGSMITGSGLTREPFYDTNGNPI